jgi:DNA-binding CsgD family transcriptional regulator
MAVDHLTPRQRSVLDALADGLSNKEIAARLGVDTDTVKVHCRAVFRAIGARNRVHAALMHAQKVPHDAALSVLQRQNVELREAVARLSNALALQELGHGR